MNTQQTQAVNSAAHTTIVIAGPGSGKTQVLVERVRRRITEDRIPPGKVVILTFTNAAAHELVNRLLREGIRDIGYVGTLHGWCFRLLQRFAELGGYRKGGVSLISEKDSVELLDQVRDRMGSRISRKILLAARECWQDCRGDEKLIWAEYHHLLKRSNMVDYDSLLVEALRLLRIDEVRDRVACEELLVDEAQDSSKTDWAIYTLIKAASLFIVGDPDQSIYAFRGGAPHLLANYAECPFGAETELHKLETNYRSDIAICEAANHLIAHNQDRVKKSTVPYSKERGEVTMRGFANDEGEIDWAISLIKAAGVPYSRTAILARFNSIADKARDRLERAGIPVVRSKQAPDLPRDWSPAMLLMNLALNPHNDLHMKRWMSSQRMDIEGVGQKAVTNGCSLAAAIGFMPPENLSQVGTYLARNHVSADAIELVHLRLSLLPQEYPTISDLTLDLWNHEEWSPEREHVEAVTCSTIHGAKGREWDIVFILGMENGVLPLIRKSDVRKGGGFESVVEEERRLAFVGITRARSVLFLSYATQRDFPWGAKFEKPSQFLTEI